MKVSTFLKNLNKLSNQDLVEIKGVGDVLAENLQSFLNSPRYQKLILEFEKLEEQNKGLNIKVGQSLDSKNLPLSGEKVCITGTFDVSRDKIKEQLETLGAKVVSQVTSQTTILISGENSGSKLQKAQELGIKIINNLAELGLTF